MKFYLLVALSLCLAGIGVLWIALDFRNTQENRLKSAKKELTALRARAHHQKEESLFWESHKPQRIYLHQKGWIFPCSRLTAGEFLEKISFPFESFRYQFLPQTLQTLEDTSFKVTPVIIDITSILDLEVYTLISQLSKKFPGILRMLEVTLHRSSENPSRIEGKLMFEWLSFHRED